MHDADNTHFLQYLFSDMRARADQPLLCENHGAVFQTVTHREASARLASFSRALSALAIEAGDRVALHAAASPSLLIAEWALLAVRAIAVIIPRNFSVEELTETLIESKSRIVIVERLATAYHLINSSAVLPDLKHIVCFEGSAHAGIPVSSWNDFIEHGRGEPDRSGALLRAITSKDTALLFYYHDTEGKRQASRYTHALLLEHASRITSMLGEDDIRKGELVLTVTGWEHAIGHIASCYVPVLKEAFVQITYGTPDIALFDNSPHVTVGDAAFFDGIRQSIFALIRHSGQVETVMLNKALALSKMQFESARNLKGFNRMQQVLLEGTIVKKIRKLLGGRLRLLVGTDNEAQYEMELFFHTFGIDLIELPQEAFR